MGPTIASFSSKTGRISSIIIGIGINVNNNSSDFPEEIKDIATSIAIETGHPVSRAELVASMVEEMDKLASEWPEASDKYLDLYRSYNITCGRDVDVISGGTVRPAKALSINDDFSLKVKFPDGTVSNLSSGEVSLKLI